MIKNWLPARASPCWHVLSKSGATILTSRAVLPASPHRHCSCIGAASTAKAGMALSGPLNPSAGSAAAHSLRVSVMLDRVISASRRECWNMQAQCTTAARDACNSCALETAISTGVNRCRDCCCLAWYRHALCQCCKASALHDATTGPRSCLHDAHMLTATARFPACRDSSLHWKYQTL